MSDGPLLVAAVATLAGALCALADGALLLGQSSRPGRTVTAAELSQRERSHRALAFARVVAYLIAGAAVILAAPAGDRGAAVGAVVVLALVITAAESFGRVIGDAFPEATLRRLAPLVRAAQWASAPAVALGGRLDSGLQILLPDTPDGEEEQDAAAEQFRQMVAAEADVSREERALLPGVFALGETTVSEIMVPRVEMIGIELTSPWSEVLDRVRSAEHARLPVFEETLDEIVGVLYAKDLLPAIVADEPPATGWQRLVRPAAFIPTSKTLDAQLRDFRASGAHIAIVVDEYGGTAGLVTIEDILEEIVGEIRDERDVEEPEIEREGNDHFWVSGRLSLDDLSALLDRDFHRDDVTTVGGLVYELFGRVPRPGEEVTVEGFRLVVERVVRRRVVRVYFERVPAPVTQEAE